MSPVKIITPEEEPLNKTLPSLLIDLFTKSKKKKYKNKISILILNNYKGDTDEISAVHTSGYIHM